MSDKDLAVVGQDQNALVGWGERSKIVQAGKRIQSMMPGNLKTESALAVAQYAHLTDANPFRGEVYGYEDHRGNLVLTDGYKLLIREAKKVCDYDEFEVALTDEERQENAIAGDSIAYWVYVLRHDKRNLYQEELKMARETGGLEYREARKEALDFVASKGIGVVLKKEMWSSKFNKPIDPPKTMTWNEKAKQRGLKHALRKAYSLPSPAELSKREMKVGETETTDEDWQGVEIYKTKPEQQRAAQVNAWTRQREENLSNMDDAEMEAHKTEVRRVMDIMRNNGDEDFIDEPPTPPEPMIEDAEIVEDDQLFYGDDYLSEIRDRLHSVAAESDKKGLATNVQVAMIQTKLPEYFAPDANADVMGMAVLNWLFGEKEPQKLKSTQASALLKWILLPENDTGDYPIRQELGAIIKSIYNLTQENAGQLKLAIDTVDDLTN